jgi:hypothetical protein
VRRRSGTRALAAAASLAAAATAAGCGSSAGTITVGAAAPAAAVEPAGRTVAAAVAVGPGPFRTAVRRSGYRVSIAVKPNRASTSNRVSVELMRDRTPVTARVRLTVRMETMDMGTVTYALGGHGPYDVRTPAWVMAGRWQLLLTVHPAGGRAFDLALDDLLRG